MESCLIFSKSFNSDPDLVSINAFPCNQYMKSDLNQWLSQFQERILRTQTGGIQGLGVGLSVYDHIEFPLAWGLVSQHHPQWLWSDPPFGHQNHSSWFFTLLSFSLGLETSALTYLAFVCIWLHCLYIKIKTLFDGSKPAGWLIEKVS